MTAGAAPRPGRIYAIADAEALAPRTLADRRRHHGGCRDPDHSAARQALPDDLLFAETERCLRQLEGWPGTLWIDDRVDLAMLLPLAGVHLGRSRSRGRDGAPAARPDGPHRSVDP